MKTSKQIFEEENERIHLYEKGYLDAEKEIREKQMMNEWFEEEMAAQSAKIVLRKAKKADKFAPYATVTYRKKPRILKYIQFKSGGI